MNPPVIVRFHRDLRLTDNAALTAALDSGHPVIPVYIHDEHAGGEWAAGGASRWWLHDSLEALAAGLEQRGAGLVLRRGEGARVLEALIAETGARAVHFSRSYEPEAAKEERRIKELCAKRGVECRRFAGALLFEPESIATRQGTPFKVFTPFYKACLAEQSVTRPLPAPDRIPAPDTLPPGETLTNWGLKPTAPDWAGGLEETWRPGEAGAKQRLDEFLAGAAHSYAEGRDRPDRTGTSMLSPHLAFGELSPRACWHAVRFAGDAAKRNGDDGPGGGHEAFLRELVWREFCRHLLFHRPDLPEVSFRPEFENFPWRDDRSALEAWQRGRSGYPLVDAGMRQLWRIGWMHNRVRMVTASFLIKHLLIDWREGQRWFWDTLVDADLANNAAGWQWVAGSGADAAPYFRIFNPVAQGERFDPDGAYVRRWVPELAALPSRYIHQPWSAPADVLAEADVRLDQTYPAPIVDHKAARERALEAFRELKLKA